MFELLTAMAEGISDVSIEPDTNVERTVDYHKLIDYGLDKTVAGKLDEIYKTGEISSKGVHHTRISSCQVTVREKYINV